MKINPITQLKLNNNHEYHIKNSTQKNGNISKSGVYNPIYYKDYNVKINFGKRSPEDFYAQDFNRNNMPSTMKEYLYEDFPQRSKIAPVQIMQEAFDDLHYAFTVEDIKEYFPNEEKFQKLLPANYNKATHGILRDIKEIKALQDTPEPLFKDGCDDLTTYLVKKIYLEGKTVKEIDKDFAKDINEIYQLAARVPADKAKSLGKNESAYFSHTTVYRLGIRFPEIPFWNSFINTRDDYDKVKRVKTSDGKFVNADSPEGKEILRKKEQAKLTSQETTPAPKKYNFKRDRLKNISDTIVNTREGGRKAMKELSRKRRDSEELTFLQRYWSEIMSIATEKIHLSEELIDFNIERKIEENNLSKNIVEKLISGEDFTKKEQTPLKIFWNERSDLKRHFSTAITDTIVLFTDAFGADGNNVEFKQLIEYAQEIKPKREAKLLEHSRIQAEYDEMGKHLDEIDAKKALTTTSAPEIKKIEEIPLEAHYKYIIQGEEITATYDVVKQGKEAFKQLFDIMPKQTYETYLKELENEVSEYPIQFWFSSQIDPESSEISEKARKVIFPIEKMNNIHKNVANIMKEKHNPLLEKTRLALELFAVEKGLIPAENLHQYGRIDILLLKNIITEKLGENANLEEAQKAIQKFFNNYSQPLSNKERIKIKMDLFQGLKDYTGIKTIYPGTIITPILQLLSEAANDPKTSDNIKKLVNKCDTMLQEEGPVLRYLLDPNGKPEIKKIIHEQTLKTLFPKEIEQIAIYITQNKSLYDQLLAPFPKEREIIKQMAKKAANSTIKIII